MQAYAGGEVEVHVMPHPGRNTEERPFYEITDEKEATSVKFDT